MSIETYYESGIVIQRKTSVSNGLGGMVDSWSTHLTIDGRIRPLSGNEKISADKNTLYVTHRLYCSILDITEKDRVLFNGVKYEVKFVANPMNFGRYLMVDLEEVS